VVTADGNAVAGTALGVVVALALLGPDWALPRAGGGRQTRRRLL